MTFEIPSVIRAARRRGPAPGALQGRPDLIWKLPRKGSAGGAREGAGWAKPGKWEGANLIGAELWGGQAGRGLGLYPDGGGGWGTAAQGVLGGDPPWPPRPLGLSQVDSERGLGWTLGCSHWSPLPKLTPGPSPMVQWPSWPSRDSGPSTYKRPRCVPTAATEQVSALQGPPGRDTEGHRAAGSSADLTPLRSG